MPTNPAADFTVELVPAGGQADSKVQVVADQVLVVSPADAGKVVTVDDDGNLVLEDPTGGPDLSDYMPKAGAEMTGTEPVEADNALTLLYLPLPDLDTNGIMVKGLAGGADQYAEALAFLVLEEGTGDAQDTTAAGKLLMKIGTRYGEIGTQGPIHSQLGARKTLPGNAADLAALTINPDQDCVGISIGMKPGAATQAALQLFGSTAPMASVKAFSLDHLGNAQWFINDGTTYGAAIFPQTSPALGVRAHFAAGAAAIIPLLLGGAAGQTGDLLRWVDSAAVTLGSFDSAGRIRAPRGALATVGYGFQGDPNTGLYSAGADAFSLVANSIAKATVDTNGLTVVSGWLLATSAASGVVLGAFAPAATDIAIVARGAASQTADIQEWQSSAAAVYLKVNKAGYLITKKVAAPADGDLAASEMTFWLDATNGAPTVRWKGKDSAGTVFNQTVLDRATADAEFVAAKHGGREVVQNHGSTGATETIDVANGNVHVVNQDQACTYTFTNPASSDHACSFTLLMTGVTGAATWPASVNWPDGTPPTLSGRCLLTFVTVNGGTDWDGFLAGKALA